MPTRELIGREPKGVPANRRRDARTAVRWIASCRHNGVTLRDIAVVDASDGGLGLGMELPFPVGDVIRLALADIGTLSFRIAWIGSGRTGLAAVEDACALSDTEVASLADALQQQTAESGFAAD